MTGRNAYHAGSVLKFRPVLSRWRDSPIAQAGIAARWMAWLINGWPLTTLAAIALFTVVTVFTPWLVVIAVAAAGWALFADTHRFITTVAGVVSVVVAAVLMWLALPTVGQVAVIGLVAVWPLDAIAGLYAEEYRTRRLWCELRRGFPVRFAIMAAKSRSIQGVMDGEEQLLTGRRPILDHPALDRTCRIDGDTVWARCSVSSGRNHDALREVIEELASSYAQVQRMDLIFIDDHQTFGWLVIRFGPPLMHTNGATQPRATRAAAQLYTAIPHTAAAACLVAATWLSVTHQTP